MFIICDVPGATDLTVNQSDPSLLGVNWTVDRSSCSGVVVEEYRLSCQGKVRESAGRSSLPISPDKVHVNDVPGDRQSAPFDIGVFPYIEPGAFLSVVVEFTLAIKPSDKDFGGDYYPGQKFTTTFELGGVVKMLLCGRLLL